MAAQEDASPWTTTVDDTRSIALEPHGTLPGRAFFSHLGIVRRKPARGDAPPTLSKSCSDKIALKQCTSLISSLTSLLVNPNNAYIDTLVLPQSQWSASGCKRAFSADGRMGPVAGKQWTGGYAFKPFTIEVTDVEFRYSKRSVRARSSSITASNLATTWSSSGFEETLIGGILQGRKPTDVKGASHASRRAMWTAAVKLVTRLNTTAMQRDLAVATYGTVKDGPLLADRRAVKDAVRNEALMGWVRNEGGSDFSISVAN
jgi:tRNA-specific adenosine deaminase 1